MKEKTKTQKGITLVALIITIVMLLILAVVTINSITNDGIISKTQDVANRFNQAQKDEQDILDEYLNYLNPSNGSSGEDAEELDLVERYVLGAEKTGRSALEIVNVDIVGAITSYKDEASTIADASTSITQLNSGYNDSFGDVYSYFEYNNKAYKAVVDYATYQTKDVEMIYKPEGREGTTVAYDSNGDGETEDWIILTDRDGKVEIVSAEEMGSLTLGYEDISVTVTTDLDGDGTVNDSGDKAIASYNNAITTINNYCKSLVTVTDNVRSVGGTDNTFTAYSSTNYDNWGSSITVDVAAGDMQYEMDLVKLSYFEKVSTTNPYWLASRFVYDFSNSMLFYVRCVYSGALDYYNLWYVNSDGGVYGSDYSFAVRPVVINPSGI